MKGFITLLLCCNTLFAFSQLTSNKGHIWLRGGYGFSSSGNYAMYSLSGEYLLKKRIGLNYNFDFLDRSDSLYQFHSSVGSIAGPPIILFSLLIDANDGINSDFDLGSLGTVLGIVMLIAPDGVSYHIPIRYHWDLAPYVNVLGLDVIRDSYLKTNKLKWATSYGLKASYWLDNGITFNTFIETRKTASLAWQFGGGLGIGYSFSPREEE